jgi:hypothetical protein
MPDVLDERTLDRIQIDFMGVSRHTRMFGFQKPFILAMTSADPYRRVFWGGEWRGGWKDVKRRAPFHRQRYFNRHPWRREYTPLSVMTKWGT